MAKKRSTINVRIPPYHLPNTEWRKDIHRVAYEKAQELGIEYGDEDHLEIWVKLYFDPVKFHFVDVDNRLKDVLDALQGNVSGSEGRSLPPIIPDDSQSLPRGSREGRCDAPKPRERAS